MIVGTAGHIDHGKTALVRALTGIDADRLPEEKARGITVDLGFAYHRLPDGRKLGFVDVPGHERLVRNMLAGAIGVDRALLVVAADDGPMPQTREHLAIIDLAGIADGVIALTKIDRVEPGRVHAVTAEIHRLTRGTVLEDAPVIPCSSLTGEGIAELEASLCERAPPRSPAGGGHFRLAIDRAFTLQGVGIVVTGAVHAGEVRPGDRLVLSPAGTAVRVRGLRSQDEVAETGGPGQRCALNLAGTRLEKKDISRGDWVVAPQLHAPSTRMDVRLRLLPGEAKALRHWTPVHAHLGSADINGRVALLEDKALEPGEAALAQLVLDAPTGALRGDRFVIRDQSATRTVGGGRVIDPFPPKRGARKPERLRVLAAFELGEPRGALAALLGEATEGVDLAHFRLIWNLTEAEAEALWRDTSLVRVTTGTGAELGFAPARWAALGEAILAGLASYQDQHPDSPGATTEEIVRSLKIPKLRPVLMEAVRRLAADRRIARFGALIHLPGHEVRLTVEDESFWEEIRAALAAAGADHPRVAVLAQRLQVEEPMVRQMLERLARIGRVRKLGKDYFVLPEVVATLAAELQRIAEESPERLLTVGRFRAATGITRHMVMPVLEFFDRIGLTRRSHDGRRVQRDYASLVGEGG